MSQPVRPTSRATLSPGTVFGSYEIMERLGAGGMGEVYRARDTRLGRQIAIKTILLDQHSQADLVARFEQEARSAGALNHPNIVTIYELGHLNGTHYIAMELVCGETVREMLDSGPIPFRKSLAIAAQVADALAEAHEAELVHRDLKPENVMVTYGGTAKVLDFGLAKLLSDDRRCTPDSPTTIRPITQRGIVMGTIGYMSPEQASGEVLDFRSDQFSFGAVLYEMVSGRAAFRGKSQAEIMAAILRDSPERLGSALFPVPPPFFWILERCLAKDPTQRYASTRDLARDLATLRDRLVDTPVQPATPRPSNLPVQRTAFIGREREAADLRQLLLRDDVRLVTLTGPGGIGKTRLALQVAGEIAEHFPGGACFVSLSAVTAPGLIAAAIAQALGVRESANQSPRESLEEFVRALTQPVLLLLDNFEHLVSAASLVAELLTLSRNLKAVVTSQSPLHVYGEHEFPVPPLALPDHKNIRALDALSRSPAVALFVERARAVKHEFALTRENAPAVAAMCARLDGLPLAIELAAARVKLLSPAAMLARLESSLNLLTGGARDLPVRQQTLRGTLDWSYSLLTTPEQTLLRRLAVFVGGCTLEAAEAVCDTKGDIGTDVLEGMASIVDKSLAKQLDQAAGETRFLLLTTIHEYALEQLAASGDEAATRRAHAAYYLVLAEEGAEQLTAHPEWLERFELEHDNFRVALEYLITTEDAEWALRLGAALFRFWELAEHLREGRAFAARLLKLRDAAAHPKLRARLLFAAAVLVGEQGDYNSAKSLFEENLKSCRELNDDHAVAVALNALAVNARDRGDLPASSSLFEQCVAIWKDLDGPVDSARALSNLANVTKMQHDYERASALYDEALRLFREKNDAAGVAWTLNSQGDVAREIGNFTAAHSCYEESLNGFLQLCDDWGIASTLCDLASLICQQDKPQEAERLYRQSIKLFHDLGHKRGVAKVLECMATTAAAQSRAEDALRLAGAAAALRQSMGAPLNPAEQAKLEAALEATRRTLGNAAGLAAWTEGWSMPLERAIQEALGSEPASAPTEGTA